MPPGKTNFHLVPPTVAPIVFMQKTLLPYPQVPQLAKTDVAYAIGDPRLRPFYTYEPVLAGLEHALEQRAKTPGPRTELVQVLREQYQALPQLSPVQANLEALLQEDTFTVTTAHQPSLFLGPLFFLYKAVTTINLAETVQRNASNGRRIVPVFVLGSEDHDLAELNSIQLFGKKLTWESTEQGAVGSMPTAGLTDVLAELKTILGESEAAQSLFARVEQAYTQAPTLAAATQALLHDLFGRYGLVVVDMNDARLKRHFIPVMRAEILEQPAYRIVNETNARLQAVGFKTQAVPREINLFYLQPGSRERITQLAGGPTITYQVLNTELTFSQEELLAELEQYPERFSPNVVLRPLFQETILPNLAYVGGGGELAYWLERKDLFAHFDLPFPVLIRRNSVLWLDRETGKKLGKLHFTALQLFDDTESLIRTFVAARADGEVDLTAELRALHEIFDRITQKAQAVDPTLEKAVRAEEVKYAGGLEQWQSRLVRAEKQKHEVAINQLRALKEKLFPANGLQERTDNFLPYLLKYGDGFMDTLKENLDPLEAGFVILEEEN